MEMPRAVFPAVRCNGGRCPNDRAYWVTLESGTQQIRRVSIGLCVECTANFRRAAAQNGDGGTTVDGHRFQVIDVRTIANP